MAALPDDVRSTTAARRSVTSRRRLLDLGYSPGQINWWLATGLVEARCRGQYIVGGAAPPWRASTRRRSTTCRR